MDRLQYSNKALVGNWYEDRLDSSHAPMPELERTGKFRVTPLKMIETTPDLYTTTNQSFHGPQVPLVVPPPPQFITKNTLALALHDRKVPEGSRPYGFGSVLPRHEPGHDQRLLETTTHSTYGGKYADSEEKRREVDPSLVAIQQSKPAGKVFREQSQGIRTGGATDERLQLGESDPKSHSFVQRTWLGHTAFQDHTIAAASLTSPSRRTNNVEGLALKGLGQQDAIDRVNTDHNKKFFRKNDTLRRDTGIWNE